jgi:hypothetical protein
LLMILHIYVKIKYGDKKIIDKYIGLGDVLIFIVFALSYNPNNYILFICSGCFIGIVYWLFQLLVYRKQNIRIPLAGILAAYHIFIYPLSALYKFDPLHDCLIKI